MSVHDYYASWEAPYVLYLTPAKMNMVRVEMDVRHAELQSDSKYFCHLLAYDDKFRLPKTNWSLTGQQFDHQSE